MNNPQKIIRDKQLLYRSKIFSAIPEGSVVPCHTEDEHLYEVLSKSNDNSSSGKKYKSVTTRLRTLKDPSLQNYKLNRALDYVFANYRKFNDANIQEHIGLASKTSGDILQDAGDIGRRIHDYREAFFSKWILSGDKPNSAVDFIPPEDPDTRAVSAMRALDKFVLECDYIPIVTEKYVYDDMYEVAGTLDDIGLIRRTYRKGKPDCAHTILVSDKLHKFRCVKCELKYSYDIALLDLKSSNQFKDHYFFQVALYAMMFKKLTGIKPNRCFILKVSKLDGTYKIEELKKLHRLVNYSKNILRADQGIEFVRAMRKDNQKKVVTL